MGSVIRCFMAEAFDYQPITNPVYPVYNADRGPVSILSKRRRAGTMNSEQGGTHDA
jgi:hypothetical protein